MMGGFSPEKKGKLSNLPFGWLPFLREGLRGSRVVVYAEISVII